MLHTVNKSPFEKDSLSSCLRLSAAGSSILLFEDGVYGGIAGGACAGDISEALKNRKIHVLKADLKARGISQNKLIPGIEIVDYEGFVALAAAASKVQSWL